MEEIMPFEFRQCTSILKSTGEKAKDIKELRDTIVLISDESIFHHTYQYFIEESVLFISILKWLFLASCVGLLVGISTTVFGTPIAGAIFGVEVLFIGGLQYR